MSHRNKSAEMQSASPYVLPSATARVDPTPKPAEKRSSAFGKTNFQYEHNAVALSFLVPALVSILWWHDSIVVLQAFLFIALGLYALDLLNSRDGLATGAWIAAVAMAIASGYGALQQDDEVAVSDIAMMRFLLQLAVEGMLFCAWACWITLQFGWLYTELPALAFGMELTLHSLVPPVCSGILTNHLMRVLLDYWGMDRVGTMAPMAFAVFMFLGMFGVGCTLSSVEFRKDSGTDASSFSITSFSAQMHTMVLLLVPGMMHVLIFRERIISRYTSFADLYDLAIVWTVPYLLQCLMLTLLEESPYYLPKFLFPRTGSSTLRGTFVPAVASIVASFAMQQRYLIPLCNSISYGFNGHDIPPTWVVSLYLSASSLSALFALWIWGRVSSVTNVVFFGEYHEDVVQLSISVSGMLLGRAFGFPWSLTPLPILAFLGLSVWATTKMMRYLCIFLFVVHSTGVVVFSYRFAGIDIKMPLAIPGVDTTLIRFGTAEVFCSVLIGLVVGFVTRPSGGFGSSLLKRFDLPGIVLVTYALSLTILEVTLLHQALPENIPSREVDTDIEDSNFVYDHASAIITSCLLVGAAACTKRSNAISQPMYLATVAVAIGKGIAVYIDASESDSKIRSQRGEERLAERLLYRTLITSGLIFVMLAPSAILKPIHVKRGSKYHRTSSDGKLISSIPPAAFRNIAIYCIFFLPLILVASVPMVLSPLVMALSSHYNLGAYYNMALPLSEIVGCALSLWGIASLYMVNHYLPDGGGETWKKVAALTLLMGVGIAVSAPTVPEWLTGENDLGISNPYAGISSLGTFLAAQGHNRTGGWGILSASLATLLAITGPFELRERRHPSGRRDKTLFLRLMMFSLMFGCGISWFITVLSMSDADFLTLAIITLASMVLSFFGTVTCVLGYFIELEEFDEVVDMAKISLGAFILFLLVTCVPSYFFPSASANLFAPGGCLSTYLIVAAFVTMSLTLALRSRSLKNQASRSIGNLSCIACYVLAVINLFGRLGVAGLDAELGLTVFMGIPTSLFGTLCIAPILLALEGEVTAETRGRISRVSGATKKPTRVSGITMKNLNASNHFVPPIVGTMIVFYLVGCYTIFLRGSPWLEFLVSQITTAIPQPTVLGKAKDDLLLMAEKVTSTSQAYTISNSLQGSGFWTSTTRMGPILHTAGLVATIPSAYLLITELWYGVKRSKFLVFLFLPLNVVPLLVSHGTPSIRAISIMSLFGGIIQLCTSKQQSRSHMKL